MPTAIAYTRRCADRQDLTHGAQLAEIRRKADDEGWEVLHVKDTCSGSVPFAERERGGQAIQLLADGEADVLVVSKLDRSSRSAIDFLGLMKRANDEGWGLVMLDLGVDATTSVGRLLAGIMAQVVEWERERISERTKEGLAETRANGTRLGAPPVPQVVERWIAREAEQGLGPQAIADGLNEDGVPTARGGKRWYASTVKGVLDRLGIEPVPPRCA